MNTTIYCDGPGEYCARCGMSLQGPNQICCAAELDETVDLPEPLSRRDWRLLLRGAERERRYLGLRMARPSSMPNGADARNLERLARVIRIVGAAVGGTVMKLITVDNFARESVAQKLVADHITSERLADVMLKALQDTVRDGDSTWYGLVSDDYRLWSGMAEFCDPDPKEVATFLDQEIGIHD